MSSMYSVIQHVLSETHTFLACFLCRGQGVSQPRPNDDDVEMKESLVDSRGDPKELGSPS